MRKTLKALDVAALLHLLVFTAVVIVAGFSQDIILFLTDQPTLVTFFAALSVSLALPLLPVVVIAASVSSGFRDTSVRWLSVFQFGLILFGLWVYWVLDDPVFNYTIQNLQESLDLSGRFAGFLVLCGILLAVCLGISWFISRFVQVSDRLVLLSRAVALGAVSLVLIGWISQAAKTVAPEAGRQRQNMILVVLDGLSTKYLSPYNPQADTPEFQSLAERSIRFTNFRTNFTYTQGYFGVLYSGKKEYEYQDPSIPKPDNLLAYLQKAGVNTRWISFHNNGIPDLKHFVYDGFRSFYLLEEWAWFPRMFGLDYNLLRIEGGKWHGSFRSYREKAIKQWLLKNRFNPRAHPLESRVPQEIEALQKDPRPFFAIVHYPVGPAETAGERLHLWELETGKPSPASRFESTRKKILEEQAWTYRKEDEPAVNALREEYRKDVRQVTTSLSRFVDLFFKKGWNENTLLLVTADHGKIFSKGKYGYWYHHEEEVARVPLLMFWKGQVGTDNRLGETVDITRTALDFFNVDEKLSSHGHSLLVPPVEKPVTTLTRGNRLHREWFLNVYQRDKRYVVNVFPGNFYIRRERFQTYFDMVAEQKGAGLASNLQRDLPTLVREYGLGPDMTASQIWKLNGGG